MNASSPATLPERTPRVGELVHVRSRQWLVEEVVGPPAPGESARVRLACADDDAQGQSLEVFWDYEIDRWILEDEGWAGLADKGFDPPRYFAAFFNTLRWHCTTATDANLFQAPFRAGITIDAYQMEPLRKALRLPRVNLFIAEAHHAAPSSGGRYGIETKFTRAVRDLSERFEHRLFLSATPHNGHSNSFSTLLELLDPYRFTRGVPVRGRRVLDDVMVRRLKEDLREIQGGFPKRNVYRSRFLRLAFRPVVGAGLAVVVYFVLQTGLLSPVSSTPSGAAGAGTVANNATDVYRTLAIACLTGLFARRAMDKLREVFFMLFQPKNQAGQGGQGPKVS